MHFFLILTFVMFFGCGAFKGVYAARSIDLSFSIYLEINDAFIYPAGQPLDDPKSKPFEFIMQVRGLTDQTLETIVRDHLQGNLKISAIEQLDANLVSFFDDGAMIERVDSCYSPNIASPVSFNSVVCFPFVGDLLALNGKALIEHLQGESLRVTIQSSTDTINTVGYRLRMRELVISHNKN